jgi:hypothetical protein
MYLKKFSCDHLANIAAANRSLSSIRLVAKIAT